jgi:beta-N-acetylhexosaminidase
LSSNPDTSGAERPRAIIFGCSGTSLSEAERGFFRSADPLGFILFRRNVDSPDQVRGLVAALRDSIGRADAPILIDQEGGRVARLTPPHWPALPPARAIGQLAERDHAAGLEAAASVGRCIGAMLAALDIDVACAPVVDLLLAETHAVIGDRAFAADPALAGALARAACEGFQSAGVTPIVKHIPGHGRATADSHQVLPRIDAPADLLGRTDFAAFRAVHDAPWAMVAHCVYTAFDPDLPASTSRSVIARVIRDLIGFDGILIADDIGMKALQNSLAESAERTLAAGCDLTLHCSGDLAEMESIAPSVPPVTDEAATRLVRADVARRRAIRVCDVAAEAARIRELLAA